MKPILRTLSRVAGLAMVLTGATALVAGQASANDRSVAISCTDQSAGTWTVSVTFSSIEVREDRPVTVKLGSQTATLTDPTPNGTVTLSQVIPGGDATSLTWSVVRLDYQNMGILNLDRPDECRETTTVPPSTEQVPTTPAPTEPTVPVTPAPSTPEVTSPTSSFQSPTNPTVTATVLAEVVTAQELPATGGSTLPLLLLGGGALTGGVALVVASRRRPEAA